MTEASQDYDVADRLRELVIAVLKLDIPPHGIGVETNLYELGMESISVVELLTRIEIAFDITIDVEDLSAELFSRFGSLLDFVQRKSDGAR